jgi:hypothetical protein
MTELKITLPNHDDMVGKTDEIAIIQEVHLFFENRNLYLSSFFRPELVDWAISCIENDVAPDIWADRNYHIQLLADRGTTIHKLRAEIETTKDEYDTQYENLEHNLIERDEKITGLKDQLETSDHYVQQYKDEIHILNGELHNERVSYATLSDKLAVTERKLIEHKAMLWDALSAETSAKDMPE